MDKAQIKLLRSLQLKKNRKKEGLFFAEGKKTVEDLLKSSIQIKEIYITDEWTAPQTRLSARQASGSIVVTNISKSEMEKISALTTSQGILAVCAIPPEPSVQPNLKEHLVLALDRLSDPGNMGTIIRIAHWFGVKHIYCSADCTDAYSPKVVQASMASIAAVTMHYGNLTELLGKARQEIPIYGAMVQGKSVYAEKISPNGIIVIGNESVGISNELVRYITNPISIPSYSNYGPESLNASVAAGIICAEFRRRA